MAEVELNLEEEQNEVADAEQSPEGAALEEALEETLEETTPEENAEELPAEELPEEKPQEESPAAAGAAEKKWPGWPGDSVFRMLVPAQKVGSIIGRKGEFIKKIVEETRARIKILDGPPGTAERAVSPLSHFSDGLWFSRVTRFEVLVARIC